MATSNVAISQASPRTLQAPPAYLLEPPGKCSRCGAGMFPKVMEAVAMLRDGIAAIPYRCSACAREALVSVPLPKRQDSFTEWGEYRPARDRGKACGFCNEPLGPTRSGHQLYHLECALARNRERAAERANGRPSNRRGYVGWPEDRIQRLVKMWGDGCDSLDIAGALGISSRAAVFGYVHYFRKAGYKLPLRGKSHKRQPGGWKTARP